MSGALPMKTQNVFKTPESREILLSRYGDILNSWPLPLKKHMVDTSFGWIYTLEWGDPQNPPLILLHGSMSNSAMWIGEAAIYAEQFHVYAVDIPGEPGRSESIRLDLSSEEPVLCLEQVLKALRLGKIYLAGISMGGFFSLRFAAAFPDRVKRMALLCPAGVTSQRVSFFWKAIKLVVFGSNRSERTIRLVFGNAKVSDETIAYSRIISEHFTPVLSIPNIPDKTLARITAPTLVIAGDQDVLLDSVKSIKRLKKLVPNLSSILLPGTGHVILDQAKSVTAFLLNG
jgi:pimeloyl-ACP methyl ester carboxylesterase